MPTYAPLPSSSLDLPRPPSSLSAFKDKPFPARNYILLRKSRRCLSRLCRPLYLSAIFAIALAWQLLFNASYAPSTAPAFAIPPHETVFIAANILSGPLITGPWGQSLVQLVDAIGRDRVFVSIYGGPTEALRVLGGMLGDDVQRSIVSEETQPLDLGAMPRTTLPGGERRVKRIAWLAAVRNKVLEPLYRHPNVRAGAGAKSAAESEGGQWRKFDKILFINDVFFDAPGALRLLWGTNLKNGKTGYKAVCAADFVASWKYYDTFATRDAEGYSIGVPIFPWFSAEGAAVTRNDVLEGRDAVRVKSCWGGMVAFRGEYFWAKEEGDGRRRELLADERTSAQDAEAASKFSAGNDIATTKAQNGLGIPRLPLRFRSEPEPFWDSSECCLIHADIISLPSLPRPEDDQEKRDEWDTGIYMNPFVRTSYSASTHSHLALAQRFERLFSPVQRLLNICARMPRWNYRRGETEGEVVADQLWISVHSNQTEREAVDAAEHASDGANLSPGLDADGNGDGAERKGILGARATLGTPKGRDYWSTEGYYAPFKRTAKRGGYCGVRQLLVVKEGELKVGEGNWDNLLDQVPPVDM
ncbi:unnamed protein product [Diplocarpon coronariae]|uniref:Glycosyltransferase family 69 protein n=1 Tax=Diplocarpon coronariae TaxID=2795749 RepID=A0A218ZC15_9HELO|nr:glycosyltransferase family 69 protein [Marssonina coronariae]